MVRPRDRVSGHFWDYLVTDYGGDRISDLVDDTGTERRGLYQAATRT
jgi:hypothetical protein